MLREELAATRDAQWEQLRDLVSAYAVRHPVRRIAVVGNAPLQPDAARAAEVDAADLVIRVNSFVLDRPGAEPTLGTACHVVLFSRSTAMTPASLAHYRERAYLVPQAGFVHYGVDSPGLRRSSAFWPEDLGAIPLPNAVVKVRCARDLDPDAGPAEIIPTSGTMALWLAHEMFPGADLLATGFSFLENEQQTEWAHHAGSVTIVNKRHRLDLEARLLRSWIADGSLRYLP